MLIPTHPFRRTVPALTPPPQMFVQAFPHIPVHGPESTAWIPIPAVVRPPNQMRVQVAYQRWNRFETKPLVRHLPQCVPLPTNRLPGRKDLQIPPVPTIQVSVVPERAAQKIKTGSHRPQVDYLRLVSMQRQAQPFFNRLPHPFLQPIPLIACEYHKVICKPNQPGIGPLRRTICPMEHRIEPVKIDIGQQRRYHPTLRRSPLRSGLPDSAALPCFSRDNRCFQPHPYQLQYRPVTDPHPETRQQLLMGYRIKVPLQVSVIYFCKPLVQVSSYRIQGLMWAPSRAKTIRDLKKVRFEYRFQYQQASRLHNPVDHRRNPQGSLATIGLGDTHPEYRIRTVALAAKRVLHLIQKGFCPSCRLLNRFKRHPIYPRGTAIRPGQVPRRFQNISTVYPVIQRIQPELRLLLGLLGKFLPQSRELGRKSATFTIRQSRISGFPPFRNGLVLRQAGLRFFWQQHVYRKAPWLHPSYRASQLLWASPTPQQCRCPGYGFLGSVASLLAHSGASQVPGVPVRTRRPQSPRGSPASAHACCFLADNRLQQIRVPGHSPHSCNEAESGSLALRLAPSSYEASQVGSPLAALTRLHGKQAMNMIDSFQSIRKPQALPGAPN